jgi:hypothetical protein
MVHGIWYIKGGMGYGARDLVSKGRYRIWGTVFGI